MSEVVNLRLFRKRKAREQAAQQAAENRTRYGRTPAQREREAAEQAEAQRRLDALRREKPPEVQSDE